MARLFLIFRKVFGELILGEKRRIIFLSEKTLDCEVDWPNGLSCSNLLKKAVLSLSESSENFNETKKLFEDANEKDQY